MKQNDFNAQNNELGDEVSNSAPETPEHVRKPVKRLVKTNKIRNGRASEPVQQQNISSGEYHGRYEAVPDEQYHGQHEATPGEPYHGRYEAAPDEQYHGRYEAAPDEQYHGQHEASPNEPYHGRYEAATAENDDVYYDDSLPADDSYDYEDDPYRGETVAVPIKAPKEEKAKNIVIKIAAVVLSLLLIILLILNMPIIAYNKEGQPLEKISIVTFLKRWQPLNIEGDLDKPNLNLNVNSDIVNNDFTDGLDLPQTIEGQYSVLFLGFDEDGINTDVNWIFQFDIAAAKINVLQIPRDTFMPSYADFTGKFNSIYGSGNPDVKPVQRVVNAVQENFGIPIDAYVTTHCYDIVSMVDLVGGIPITLDEGIMYEADKIIPAGESVLSGQQAEWFVRYRHGFAEGDIGRVKNQRKFLAAAMEKLLNIYADEGRMKFYGYLKEIYENEYIHTDLSLEEISMIADFASSISLENVQVNMVPGEGANYYPSAGSDAQSVWSVHKQATIDMLNEYFRPYQYDMLPEESALVEYVTDYLATNNDNTSDTLQELQDGVKPGQNETKPASATTENSYDNGYGSSGYDNSYDYNY